MSSLNWEQFQRLSGDANHNFEYLCRNVIRRVYGGYGKFSALANQPGVEFHIKIDKEAPVLGASGRWWGWQCKWFEYAQNGALKSSQKRNICDSLDQTVKHLSDLTDWVLWTRRPLSKADKQWYESLQEKYNFALHSWSDDLDDYLLSDNCIAIKESYFGNLILNSMTLQSLHCRSVERIGRKWLPEVHQASEIEDVILKSLGRIGSWEELVECKEHIDSAITQILKFLPTFPSLDQKRIQEFLPIANDYGEKLLYIYDKIQTLDMDIIWECVNSVVIEIDVFKKHASHFRGKNSIVAIYVTNLSAFIDHGIRILRELRKSLSTRMCLVSADAGCGKTHLSAEVTKPTASYSAGILLHGIDFHSHANINHLVSSLSINSRQISVFDELLEALNAHGIRTKQRIPIVIDALNESEDPRVWKGILGQLYVALGSYPYVMLVATVRPHFLNEVIPESPVQILEMTEMESFSHSLIKKYFNYYKIDPIDANINQCFLRTPLTVRVFCEATNPERLSHVGVERMPRSHSEVFSRYIENIIARIVNTAPAGSRCDEYELKRALDKIGQHIWTNNAREFSYSELEIILGDNAKSWDQRILRQFIASDILIRHDYDNVSFSYDHLAGYIIAHSLYSENRSDFLGFFKTIAHKLDPEANEYHPLFDDIAISLNGIMLSSNCDIALWQFSPDSIQIDLLFDSILFNGDVPIVTIDKVRKTIINREPDCLRLLNAMQFVRAAVEHPFNSIFMDICFRDMSIASVDLLWTEWIRKNKNEVLRDIIEFRKYWKSERLNPQRAALLANWTMWSLTSTVCELRDQATKTLMYFGKIATKQLFEMTLQSLSIKDPYVSERMLAASYGLVLSCIHDPKYPEISKELPEFALKLYRFMFAKDSPCSTKHYLSRDYALNIIHKACLVSTEIVNSMEKSDIAVPFPNTRNSFIANEVAITMPQKRFSRALGMDFSNYVIGSLIPERRNWDNANPEYIAAMHQIEQRVFSLGYSDEKFGEIDKTISDGMLNRLDGRIHHKTERYGKKYSWIAYFEMYGARFDSGLLPEWKQERIRPAESDIDPTFPEKPQSMTSCIEFPFSENSKDVDWLKSNFLPDYEKFLINDSLSPSPSPFILLHGDICPRNVSLSREFETCIRAVLIDRNIAYDTLIAKNHLISFNVVHSMPAEHYSFAGEMLNPEHPVFSEKYPYYNQPFVSDATFVNKRLIPQGNLKVEIPTTIYEWEYYHSQLNQVSGIPVLSPNIINFLNLHNIDSAWDLFDSSNKLATIFRTIEGSGFHRSHLFYLRTDLLSHYLKINGLSLLWLVWGTREISRKGDAKLPADVLDIYRLEKNQFFCNKLFDEDNCSFHHIGR